MLKLIAWAGLLLIQNASFTLVSRARNSGSIQFHAVASVFSNGVWFASQIFVVNFIVEAFKANNLPYLIFIAFYYTVFTVIGSVSMHFISMKYFEKGKRKVGAI